MAYNAKRDGDGIHICMQSLLPADVPSLLDELHHEGLCEA